MKLQSLGREDPLNEEMATHCSILPGESHGQRSLMGYSPWGCRVGHHLTTEHVRARTHTHTRTHTGLQELEWGGVLEFYFCQLQTCLPRAFGICLCRD